MIDRVTISNSFRNRFQIYRPLSNCVDENGILLHQIFHHFMNFLLDRSTVYISKLQWFMFSNERNISRFEYHRLCAIDSREDINDFIAIIFRNMVNERHCFKTHLKIYFIVTGKQSSKF